MHTQPTPPHIDFLFTLNKRQTHQPKPLHKNTIFHSHFSFLHIVNTRQKVSNNDGENSTQTHELNKSCNCDLMKLIYSFHYNTIKPTPNISIFRSAPFHKLSPTTPIPHNHQKLPRFNRTPSVKPLKLLHSTTNHCFRRLL